MCLIHVTFDLTTLKLDCLMCVECTDCCNVVLCLLDGFSLLQGHGERILPSLNALESSSMLSLPDDSSLTDEDGDPTPSTADVNSSLFSYVRGESRTDNIFCY